MSSTGNSVFQLFVLGAYFFLYGLSNIRDGFLFEGEIGKNHLKRRIRISLPIVLAALIPARTLAKINKFMQENADEREDIHLGMVKSGKTRSLKFLFIQLRPLCFRQLVMWISAIKAVLFLMATMIRLLRPYLAW